LTGFAVSCSIALRRAAPRSCVPCRTVLAEVESSQARNRSWPEMREAVLAMAKKYLPLNSTTAGSGGGVDLTQERMKDHVSHFVLRLAFCRR
jgi:DNA primase large subunit